MKQLDLNHATIAETLVFATNRRVLHWWGEDVEPDVVQHGMSVTGMTEFALLRRGEPDNPHAVAIRVTYNDLPTTTFTSDLSIFDGVLDTSLAEHWAELIKLASRLDPPDESVENITNVLWIVESRLERLISRVSPA